MLIRTDAITTIAGMRGSGKTSLAKRILAKIRGDVVVYDIQGEYSKKISFIPEDDSREAFDRFMASCWDRGNIYICVDEAEQFMRGKKPLTPYCSRIVNRGRHRNIGLLVITRRIAELNKTVFGLSHTAILFQMFLPNDIRYVSEFYNDAEKLRDLPRFKYRIFSMESVI